MPNEKRPAYMEAEWFEGLRREVKSGTQKAVADRMGISRSTLAIVLNGLGEYGNGKSSTVRIEMRYRQAFEQIECPFSGNQVGVEHCREKALGAAPTHNPLKMQQWQACQACQYRPKALSMAAPKAPKAELPMAALDTKTLPLPEVGAPQIQTTTEEIA
ncbi:MarR family transcriptional regulator [Cupriavidus sp. BIC8F]|uniref:MarR family transcriptional regulator n=1 Tax=Cupriavidus sp. BIC8F TaxID=3079014 RepID=UPI0029164545|nr:MarR family transcriptional regulator [Cupriavidus sp. BIC8F]